MVSFQSGRAYRKLSPYAERSGPRAYSLKMRHAILRHGLLWQLPLSVCKREYV